MKEFFVMVGIALSALALVFGLTYFGYQMYGFFAPKYRAVDNQVFKESEQYNDGMIRDLENLQMQYMNANADQKAALKDIILHRFAVYDVNRLPNGLFSFYTQLKAGQL